MKSKVTLVFAFSAVLAVILAAGVWAADAAKPAKAARVKHARAAGVVDAVDTNANPATITITAKKAGKQTFTLGTDYTVLKGKEKAQIADVTAGSHVQLKLALAADKTKSVSEIRIVPQRKPKAAAAGTAAPAAPVGK